MTIGLCPDLGAALYSSETQCVMLNLLHSASCAKGSTEDAAAGTPSKNNTPSKGGVPSSGASTASSGSFRLAGAPNGWRPGHCTHRIDLDEGGGEVVQVSSARAARVPAGLP